MIVIGFLPFLQRRRRNKNHVFRYDRPSKERLGYKVTNEMHDRYRSVVVRRRFLRFRIRTYNQDRRELAWRLA